MKASIRNIFLLLFLANQFWSQSWSQNLPPLKEQMDAAEQYSLSKGGQTFVVVYDGTVIRESYTNGGSKDRVQLLASATKGLVGMTGAIAAYDSIINLDQPVTEVLTEWKNDPQKSLITYRHLLTMSSGLEELKDQKAWADFLLAKVMFPAGSTFVYGPDPNLFGLALQRKLGTEKIEDYMNRRLFQPLGIRVEWRGGFSDENPQLCGGAYVRAIEWMKYGEFVRLMIDGKWNGPQLLSRECFDQVFNSSYAHPAYGFYWWLKRPVPDSLARIIDLNNNDQYKRQIKPLVDDKNVSNDFVMCRGAYGQCLYVIPSRKLVVVRNAPQNAGDTYKDNELLDYLLGGSTTAITENETLPAEIILNQNYPNPFNPATTIRFDLPEQARVTIEIYNLVGQKIKSLLNENKAAGCFSLVWEGKDEQGVPSASGLYFYRLEAKTAQGEIFTQTHRMVMLK